MIKITSWIHIIYDDNIAHTQLEIKPTTTITENFSRNQITVNC